MLEDKQSSYNLWFSNSRSCKKKNQRAWSDRKTKKDSEKKKETQETWDNEKQQKTEMKGQGTLQWEKTREKKKRA